MFLSKCFAHVLLGKKFECDSFIDLNASKCSHLKKISERLSSNSVLLVNLDKILRAYRIPFLLNCDTLIFQ